MKRPSFQFYPADWRTSYWVKFDGCWPEEAPLQPCCYAIYFDGVLGYVGQTSNLRKRLYAHKIGMARYSEGVMSVWGGFDNITIKAHFGRRYGDWAMREVRLIKRLQPRFNCVGSTKRRAAA